ncbi:hypothetical protein ROZALSC1DRAFT_30446 [Rozella allomycis CSF55]|uniref:Tafazzin family protein n=1 Tax=Rozella allomycis (strain CSF55) TaxID=988480 RepID=A0A075ARW3_ROZAC|nr:Tafazzin domain-containing protein [Rozella allomycis CSF55]RKP17788.1 hypothetical protein ROZALSC1DRAFT_30446 [Rozella allomycis CSF55]|eukprot:EPZ31278.1 Tafazzin domain-containing protein [Rozella allomycis CSF55]
MSLQRFKVVDIENLLDAIQQMPRRCLITFSNHNSTIDDPTVWAALPLTNILNVDKLRFALGARELTYMNTHLSWFFSRGQVIPIERGKGIFQKGMDDALKILNEGGWVHIYPEVFQDQRIHPLRWGISRLILEAKLDPILVPIIHHGMEHVYPLTKTFPKLRKTVVCRFGKPLRIDQLLTEKQFASYTDVMKRIEITNAIQKEMQVLYDLDK